MKKLLLSLSILISFTAAAQCPTISGTVTPVSCPGGNNGAINLSVTGGAPFQGLKGLLISEVHANPTSTDAPFEFVELIATRTIDFSLTPYTVIFNNNGTANANGWIAGGTITYAFAITTGIVNAGNVVYVGGSSMIPQNNRLRTISTGTTVGDGGIGNPSASGSLGNGGTNADGIAVFNVPVASITSTTVPDDAIFWGTGTGTAVVASGTAGYELPVNDQYNGGKLQTTSFLGPDQGSVVFLVATGTYNVQTNTFTTPRVWANTPTFTDLSSSVMLNGIYNYSWSTSATTEDITGLSANTYTVSVTDAVACVSTATFIVTEPAAFVTTITSTPTSCGSSTGEAIVSVSGGTPGYTFLWSPSGGTNDTASALAAGSYSVTITDNNGCTTIATTTISSTLTTLTSATNASCHPANGISNGTIVVSVLNGNGPYTHSWTPNVSTTSAATGLSAGTYIINTIDVNGCTAADTVTVMQPAELITSISSTNPTCAFACDGNASATVSGGTPGYSYSWMPTGCNSASCGNLCMGCYTVVVTDANSCRDTASVCIVDPPQLMLAATVTPTTCAGPCDGTITYSSSGGTPPIFYSWSPTLSCSPTCTNVCPGTYTITAIDANGCVASRSVTVTSPSAAWLNSLGNDTMICEPASITVCAPAGFSSYMWSDGSTTACVTYDTTSCLSVMVVDANGCQSLDTICITDNICTGIENGIAENILSIYPNPNNGVFTLELNNLSGNVQLIIADAAGREVMEEQLNISAATFRKDIDLGELENGIYFVMIRGEHENKMVKLILSK